MKKVTQKCDYCLQEVTDEIGIDFVEIRRVYILGTKDACRNYKNDRKITVWEKGAFEIVERCVAEDKKCVEFQN
jgi:hypothetical protein